METKEYIVILHSYTDLDDFYTDMEQQGHYEHVPDRAVDLVHRRPASRSTHYQLTDDEVQILRQDPRVLDIHQPFYDLGMKIGPCDTQTSDYWSKGGSFTRGTPEMNWGVLRCVEGRTRPNWGIYPGQTNVSATVNLPNTGRHVDVVIADGHIDPGHPEFAKNPDGTGGSRVIQYQWFKEHWQQVLATRPTKTVNGVTTFNDYEYDFINSNWNSINNNNHGALAAAIAAGNTCGFARDANIYNINPYGTTINWAWLGGGYFIIDFITQFHKNKPINPATGRKNPTIVNMSFGFYPSGSKADTIEQIIYKGQTINRPTAGWTKLDFNQTGIEYTGGTVVRHLQRDTSMDNSVIDAMAEGIIFCAAAMNDSIYMDLPTGDLYDNAIIRSEGPTINYMRGGSPGSVPGVICVGAVDATVVERKAGFSNKGPRVDIYAPSVNTISARNTLDDNPPPTPAPITTTTRPPFRATCTFDPYPTSVNEGASITFTINTTGLPGGANLFWIISFTARGSGLTDEFDFDSPSGNFFIDSSGRATFNIPITADMWTEGAETFTVGIHDVGDPLSNFIRPIVTTEPITIVDTSTGNQSPPGSDIRNPAYFKGRFGGTSAACPHVTGIIACALETYPNMTSSQALSYIQTYASHGVLRDTPFNTNFNANQWFNDEHILFNGPNKYATYQPNTRPNQVHPVIGHQSRPQTGIVYPRTLINRNQ